MHLQVSLLALNDGPVVAVSRRYLDNMEIGVSEIIAALYDAEPEDVAQTFRFAANLFRTTELTKVEELTELDLSGMQLTILVPEQVAAMPRLRSLVLAHNAITDDHLLRSDVTELPLEHLDVSDNQVRTIRASNGQACHVHVVSVRA